MGWLRAPREVWLAVGLFALLLNIRVMDWVGFTRDRGAAQPPTAARG